jgi:beta-glucanase (GH16 family)
MTRALGGLTVTLRRSVSSTAALLVVVVLASSGCSTESPSRADGGADGARDLSGVDVGPRDLDPGPDVVAQRDAVADTIDPCPGGYGGKPSSTTPPIAGNWTLSFEEHFLGPRLDGAKWKVGAHWAGYTGKSSNDPRNQRVSCGYLELTAEKRSVSWVGKSYDYASSEVTTFKRFRQRYGYFEARIKYDGIRGLWPAFWLMPDRGKYGNVDNQRGALLKFDLGKETRSAVKSATLELYVEEAGAGVQNLQVLPVHDDSWSEASVSWKSRPPIDPAWVAMAFDPKWKAGDRIKLDVTALVNAALAGDKIVSLALLDSFMRDQRVHVASREASDASRRPRLVLDGAAAPLVASEDATIRAGAHASDNLGAEPTLQVNEPWANTASTYDGGMEVDIMESLGSWGAHRTSHALHWDGYGGDHKKQGSGHVDLTSSADGFHIYGVSWQPGVMRFYVDGVKTWEWNNARVSSVASYLLLSLQVGGWADSYGDNRKVDDGKLPGKMLVDYVRVWSGAPN